MGSSIGPASWVGLTSGSLTMIWAGPARAGDGPASRSFWRRSAKDVSARAVLSLEASRLARNGRDWHTLLEFCGLVGTLIIDEDGIYDAASPNDRLLLGMKGTIEARWSLGLSAALD